ncbi:uncharacterized protein LOC143585195 [Bidens hawaiensis]|uniref:uncharacterized protein LOC143585195 n=1 Tax=Bidens hawaiensis TaxID=980011 RepID=UPI00404A5C00
MVPQKDEELIRYLSASAKAVGADSHRRGNKIFHHGKTGPSTGIRVKTPPHIFLVHPISVSTNYKIQNVLRKPELSGRLAKWAIELGKHIIQYKPRPIIKGQILADFIAVVPSEKEDECRAQEKPNLIVEESEAWLLFTNGASNDEGSGVRLKLVSPSIQEFTYAIRLDFKNANNKAKYEAFLAGLLIADKFGAQHVEAHADLMLIANKVNGSYEAKYKVMASYLEQAK